jgi:hypothetical protein
MNSTKNEGTGYSPNILDKGRQLRGIPDISLALKQLKERINSGKINNKGYRESLIDLQDKIHLLRHVRDKNDLTYILRSMDKHDRKLQRKRKYISGQPVARYIGDQSNKNSIKWQARYARAIFIKDINDGEVQIKDMASGDYMIISRELIKPYMGNDVMWKSEMDYKQFEKEKEKLKGGDSKVCFKE